ncbi:MAG: ATP-dependent metallopeptidase FtsH/Yme1/Tma family protein, partial [Planctomycetota bacterium]
MSDHQSKKPSQQRPGPQKTPGKKPPLPTHKRSPLAYLLIGLVLLTAWMMLQNLYKTEEIRWDEFVNHVESKHIASATLKSTQITGKLNEAGIASRQGKARDSFVVYYEPEVNRDAVAQLWDDMARDGVKLKIEPPRVWLIMLMQWVLPLLILVGFFYFIFARNIRGGAGGMLMSFGRSKHRLQSKDR